MIIKVCGMRDANNIRAVERLGIQWMGFIFWPQSSRYVAEQPAYLPTKARRVGVFVDATPDVIRHTARNYGLSIIQLHGKESPDVAADLRKDYIVVKALNIATTDDLLLADSYDGTIDYLLFDTKAQLVGGNGTQFDWSVLNAYHGSTPFLLSGGIGLADADRVKAFRHPQLAGIDLNSRFELAPALKDVNKLAQFIASLQ